MCCLSVRTAWGGGGGLRALGRGWWVEAPRPSQQGAQEAVWLQGLHVGLWVR